MPKPSAGGSRALSEVLESDLNDFTAAFLGRFHPPLLQQSLDYQLRIFSALPISSLHQVGSDPELAHIGERSVSMNAPASGQS